MGRSREYLSFIPPMVAQVVERLPEGPDWMYEVKFDGYRALLIKAGISAQVRSRNDKDLTPQYPEIRAAAERLRAETAMIDGELVAVDRDGHPSFQALQHRSAYRNHTILFYAFDLLNVDGQDLTGLALEQRRERLPTVVAGSGILLSEELRGTAEQVIAAVRALGLEGVIAKRRSSRYNPGVRGGAWVKLKLDRQQEFVIGGYRPGPHGIDALLVGYYESRRLHFAGKVRAGFTPHLRREVFAKLEGLAAARCPFVDLPNARTDRWGGGVTEDQMKEMRWVTPALVVQIRFVEWTAEGHLRHAAFLGLRTDKRASTVRRDT